MKTTTVPHSDEAEMGLISSMMTGGPSLIAEVVQQLGETAGPNFHSPVNGNLYDAVVEWWRSGKPFELRMFTKAMMEGKGNRSQTMGGPAHITAVWGYVPTSANVQMYLEDVKDKRWLRFVHRRCLAMAEQAVTDQRNPEEVFKEAERTLLSLVTERIGLTATKALHEIVADVLQDLETPEKVLGISTGFDLLDAEVGGFAEGEKIVLAGNISGGKSAFSQCLANSLAVDRGIKVAIFTYEMSVAKQIQRLAQIRSGIGTRTIANGTASMFDRQKYADAALQIGQAPLHITYDRPDIRGIAARCMQLRPRVVIIDYLQIVPEKKEKGENRTEQLDRMSSETKQLAQRLDMTVIELSQLTEKSDGQTMTRGSKGILADSDQLWVLEGDDDDAKEVVEKDLIIVKQRDGRRNQKVPFLFKKSTTRFREKIETKH